MPITVRTIADGELDAWVDRMRGGFLDHPADGEAEYRRAGMDLHRSWGAFDRGQVVGTLRSFATQLTVPGPHTLASSALTNVTVASTHRRRGVLTDMITAELHRSHAAGEAIGILIASEYPIYGRFGYGAAIEGAEYSVDANIARFRERAPGTLEFVDLAALRKEAPAIYDRHRLTQPGAIERSDRWWDRLLHQVDVPGAQPYKGFQAIYRSPDGDADGFVMYHVTSTWDAMRPKAELSIDELVAATPAAYHGLWQFCCEVDLVTSVTAGNRSAEEALPWLLHDGRVVRQGSRYDFVWVRIIDAAKALGSRSYLTPGHVTVEVVDELGLASGTFHLAGGPAGATCGPTDQTADLTLPVDVLGSVYMGGASLGLLAQAGRLREHRGGALATADAMFRSNPAPWCATWF